MRRLLSLLFIAALTAGCAASSEEDGDSTNEALATQTLTAAQCKTPAQTTKTAVDANGTAVAGSAITTLSGCIVGKTGETGAAVTSRLVTLLNNTTLIGKVDGLDNQPVFSKFTPGQPSGTIQTTLVQDVDVTLNMFASPSATLRVTRKLAADGSYTLHITNTTPFKASIAFIPVTAIDPGNLVLDVETKPAGNGLTVTGNGSVQLDVQKDQAASAAAIVGQLFAWLTEQLDQ